MIKRYLILDLKDISSINWDWSNETIETARKSIDGTKVMVSFDIQHVHVYESLKNLPLLDIDQAREIINSTEWYIDDLYIE